MPKTTSAPASAAPGIRMYSIVAPWRWRNPGSAAGAIPAASAVSATSAVTKLLQMSGCCSDHALDQIIHLLELGILLGAFGAGRNHSLALVVDQRALEDRKSRRHELGLDLVGVLARGFRHLGAVGRDLDDLFLQTAAIEVRDALA